MSQENIAQRIWVASLWSRTSKKDATEYFCGSWGGARILIFPNNRKQSSASPDYHMYISESQKQTRGDSGHGGTATAS